MQQQDIDALSIQQLKAALKSLNVDTSDCLEKKDLQAKLKWARESNNANTQNESANASTGPSTMPDFSVAPSFNFRRQNGGAALKYDQNPLLMGNTANPTALMVISHGFGDSAEGWRLHSMRLIKELPHLLIYLANAPRQPVTVAGGLPMSAWFDIIAYPDMRNPLKEQRQDVEGTLFSARYISHMAGHVAHKHKIPTNRIVFGGVSQGAAVSIAAGLTAPYVPLGVLALSGFFAAADAVIESARRTNHLDALIKAKVPFALYHGDSDQVLPIALAHASLDKLKSLGLRATLKEYRGMPHTVSDTEIKDVIAWLAELTN